MLMVNGVRSIRLDGPMVHSVEDLVRLQIDCNYVIVMLIVNLPSNDI